MLAISSPLRLRSSSHGHHGEEKSTDEGEILLDDIDFDDIFVGFDDGGCDILIPDLEIDPDDIFADFSFNSSASASGSGSGSGEAGDGNIVAVLQVPDSDEKELEDRRAADQYLSQNYEVVSGRSKVEDDEEEDEYGSVLVMSAAEAEAEAAESAERSAASSSGENCRSGRKLSTTATATKGSHGKNKKSKKAKVDWTPELHRRFVQAVEQLGVDQAVPSRILQLMGIDCLTRHNIASHLQKYRSHRKHLLAREAEAASWSQRRQMYAGGGGGVMSMKRAGVDMSKKPVSWQAASPIVGGIPPPPPPHEMRPLIRPLHVWGHPSAADHRPQLVPVWPRAHLAPPPPPPQPWLPSGPPVVVGPPPPMLDHPSCWHPAQYQMALTQGLMPFFPPQLVPAMRFQAPPVPSIHPHPLFRPAPSAAAATTVNPTPNSSCNHSAAFDAHPLNEKIDAAIGDVLAKPWSALPLGLKPPSVESVMIELQRQGVAKVPPSSTSGG